MKELPEYIKYRAQCMFVFGVTLITPAGTLLLALLTFDYQALSNYNLVICLIDLFLAFLGYRIIINTHHYLKKMELEYAKQCRSD